MGPTGYIDFITWNEVIYPIMWGTDRYNRLFFVIKGYINNKRILQTIFQRHEGGSRWNGGGRSRFFFLDSLGRNVNDLLGTTGGISDEQFDFLFALIENKKAPNDHNIRLNPYIYCLCSTLRYHVNSDCNPTPSEIQLYDEAQQDAVELLQRAWRRCRYNPQYKMCEKILIRNMCDVYKERNLELK